MKITLHINDPLLVRARELTGMNDPAEIIRSALNLLIARESARWLAKLGGSDPELNDEPNRRRS